MHILIPSSFSDYTLLDSGNGYRCERFGRYVLVRPDAQCIWQPHIPRNFKEKPDAVCEMGEKGGIVWRGLDRLKEPWTISYVVHDGLCDHKLVFGLRATRSKNIGIFPEQASQWDWIAQRVAVQKTPVRVLNLFAYTGGATLAAAAAGAHVCHVDASQAAVTWARENAERSGLGNLPIRWIVDDCQSFIDRELRRGHTYHGIIMDPPPFGRDHKGRVFTFEKQIRALLARCWEILEPLPLFFIINGYAMSMSASVLYNIVREQQPDRSIEWGELCLKEEARDRILSCSIFARM